MKIYSNLNSKKQYEDYINGLSGAFLVTALAFLNNPSLKQLKEIIGLYRQTGWWDADAPDDSKLIEKIISGSHCFVIAVEDNKIIGMGRAISDGVSDSYIQDVTVNKSFQHQEVGTKIVTMLIKRLQDDGIEWIGVIAEQNSHPFYKQFGFSRMTDSTPLLLNK